MVDVVVVIIDERALVGPRSELDFIPHVNELVEEFGVRPFYRVCF
jgi:hypothetical protein